MTAITIDASLLTTLDELYINVTDAGILVADVPGEKALAGLQDRTVMDCLSLAMNNLDTIFEEVGEPYTRKRQSAEDCVAGDTLDAEAARNG